MSVDNDIERLIAQRAKQLVDQHQVITEAQNRRAWFDQKIAERAQEILNIDPRSIQIQERMSDPTTDKLLKRTFDNFIQIGEPYEKMKVVKIPSPQFDLEYSQEIDKFYNLNGLKYPDNSLFTKHFANIEGSISLATYIILSFFENRIKLSIGLERFGATFYSRPNGRESRTTEVTPAIIEFANDSDLKNWFVDQHAKFEFEKISRRK